MVGGEVTQNTNYSVPSWSVFQYHLHHVTDPQSGQQTQEIVVAGDHLRELLARQLSVAALMPLVVELQVLGDLQRGSQCWLMMDCLVSAFAFSFCLAFQKRGFLKRGLGFAYLTHT